MALISMPATTLLLGQPGEVAGLNGLDGGGIATPTNMVDPTNPGDLANKNYVDTSIAAIPSFSSTTVLDVESALTSLGPSVVDTPINVPFGPPTANSFIDLSIDGLDTEASIITFLVGGEFFIRAIISVGRTTSPGDAMIEVQAFQNGIAVSDGVFSVTLPNITSANTIFFPPILTKVALNDTLQLKFSRSSVGTNDGQLEEYVPTTPTFVTRPLSNIVIKILV